MGNSPSSVPYGAQIAQINISAICNGSFYDYSGPATLSSNISSYLLVSVTAPLSSNGQFNYTDLVVTSPPEQFGYQVIAKATAVFVTNANPSTFSISSSEFDQYSTPGIRTPTSGVAMSPPITIGSSPAMLSLVRYDVDAENADIVEKLTCFPNPHVLTTTLVGPSMAGSNAPANGVQNNLSSPADHVTNIANLPLSCSGSLIFGGTVPAFVKAGSQVVLNNVNAFLKYMAGADSSYTLQLGKDTSGNNVTGLSAILTGSSLVETDVSREFAATDSSTTNPLSYTAQNNSPGQNLTYPLPAKGSLSKSFTNNNSPFSLSVKSLQGTLSSSSGSKFLGCSAGANSILSAPVV